ncbi:MAG: hypothetical protein ACLFNM_00230 [Candidatus Woesearchaeota archaeon]
MNSKRARKGQSEIMGLIVIVVILTVAMLVYVSYSASKPASSKGSLYKEYAYNELATSYVDVLLDVSIPNCGKTSFEDLLVNCGTKNTVICGSLNSCDYVQQIVDHISQQTLKEWDIPYSLQIDLNHYVSSSQDLIINQSFADCLPKTVGRGAPGIFHIPYHPTPGDAKVELGFCMP